MSFNTIHGDFICPHCKEPVQSGIGFRYGYLNRDIYKKGDDIKWHDKNCRPKEKPAFKVIKTLGHFNCDNIKCSSWQDCYPDIQNVLITIENNRIVEVEHYKHTGEEDEFAFLEPKELAESKKSNERA